MEGFIAKTPGSYGQGEQSLLTQADQVIAALPGRWISQRLAR